MASRPTGSESHGAVEPDVIDRLSHVQTSEASLTLHGLFGPLFEPQREQTKWLHLIPQYAIMTGLHQMVQRPLPRPAL